MEIQALAVELENIAAELVGYDTVENRAHRSLSMSGSTAAEIIAALIRGDEQEAAMLARLRARAQAVHEQAHTLTGRLSRESDASSSEYIR